METDKIILPEDKPNSNENVLVMRNTFFNHGNEIQNIISNKPPLIVRWGTAFFFFMLLIVTLITWLIKYPDIVTVKARLTFQNSEQYAVIYISPNNLKKVRAGQQVILRFPSYPYQEYGSLIGKIEFISTMATDSGYLAKVKLPNGFITNYNKPIQYKDGLLSQGEIVTDNIRLLERFYRNIITTDKNLHR